VNFLPGWNPGFLAGKTPLISITQVLSATSTAATIAAPPGIQAGDLLVLFDQAVSVFMGQPTLVTPSGFTNRIDLGFTSSGVTGVRCAVATKLAVGTEGGTSLTGMSGATSNDKALLVFRGNVPAVSHTVADAGQEGTDGNPAAQTITAASGVAPLVVIGGYGNAGGGTINPRTFTTGGVGSKDGEITSNVWHYLAWKIFITSPADCVVDMDDEGSGNALLSCYIQMAA
jgi:hypothetical protein